MKFRNFSMTSATFSKIYDYSKPRKCIFKIP